MTMDNALIHTRCEQTVQHLLDKIDKVCDEARDNGGLNDEDVRTLEKAWCAIEIAMRVGKS